MKTKFKLTSMALLMLFATSLKGQHVAVPAKDSLQEISDYDISKRFDLYFKRIKTSDFPDQRIQENIFETNSTLATDPITIGLTYVALQGIIGNLESTIRTVTGDIAAHLNNLLNTTNAVLAQWDYRLADRLNRTIYELNKTERRIVEDTESLIRMAQQTIRQVETGAIELARVTAGEADILAYNITSIINRNKEARFVYSQPNKIRIGLNEPVVKFRGNFLDFRPYNFRVQGYESEIVPLGHASNEVSIKLPDDFLSTIQSETTVALTAEPWNRRKRLLWFGYRYWRSSSKSLMITLKPQVDYTIAVSIVPQAKVPTRHTFAYSFYDSDDNCNADRRIDRTYVLPPSWSLNDLTQAVNLQNTSGPNCGSGLVGRGAYNSGDFSVVVEGRIKGCGYSGPFNTFCRGRGWWGYNLFIPAKSYVFQPIPMFEDFIKVTNQNQRSFTFDYPLENIPADNQEVRYAYKITVVVQEGNSTRTVEISDVNPNVEGFRSRMDDRRLTLEIDPITRLVIAANN